VLILLGIAVAAAGVVLVVNALSSRHSDLPWQPYAALTSDARAGRITRAEADGDAEIVSVALSSGARYGAHYRDAESLSYVLRGTSWSVTYHGSDLGAWGWLIGFAILTLGFWFLLYVFAYHDTWPFRRFAVFAR
jgi:hypothetical protein